MAARASRAMALVALTVLAAGCRTTGGGRREAAREPLVFEPVVITGERDLEGLNDEELWAQGSAALAAEDFRQAARTLGRLADFFPASPHRGEALVRAGMAHQRLGEWEEALARFAPLADAQRGEGDALEAAFRQAETLYHLERYEEAVALLDTLGARADLPVGRRLQAQVQRGVCELEAGRDEQADATLRRAVATWEALEDREVVDDYYPAQAHFFRGEIYRLRSESVPLDVGQGAQALGRALDERAELLLSAQGHYLRTMRVGHAYWATAAGTQVGQMYERLHQQLSEAPAPTELTGEEADVYREEVRRRVRVLLTKAITVYERTLETAERVGARSVFVDRARESLRRLKALLLTTPEDAPEPEGGPADGEPHS